MNDAPILLFYNGVTALAREAKIELANSSVFVLDEGGRMDDQSIFPLAGCRYSVIGERMFVYLHGGSGPFLEINRYHPSYNELSKALRNMPGRWDTKLTQQKWPLLAGLLIILVICLYLLLSQTLPFVALKLISTRQETALGEKLYHSFVSGKNIDTVTSGLVQQFADQLTLSDKYPVRITVLKDDEVNAFALPGGRIVIYTGIIQVLDNPGQLVALLGHETTHINKRHSLKGMLSGLGMAILKSAVLSGFGNVGDIILRNAGSLQQLSYSRKLEREADHDGMELMLANRVDPSGMKELMEGLQKAYKDRVTVFSFISTHPLTDERIKTADQFIQKYKNMTFAGNRSLDDLWKQLKK
jgi:predicted Zn-dependent protease